MTTATLTLAACTSEASKPPATNASTETPAATENPSTSTTVDTTTSSTTTTTTSTTIPPTSTTTPDEAITQAIQDYWLAYAACGAAPEACDPSSFLAANGRSRAAMTDFVAGLIARSYRFSTDLRGSYIAVESVDVRGESAVAISCLYDAGIVLGPPGPDGQPTRVADGAESVRNSNTLFLEGGEWRVGEEEQLERIGDGDRCGRA